MNNLKYIFMILLGGIMYGTMSSFVKLSYSWGYNAEEISFTQALFASIVLGSYTLIATKGNKGSFKAKNIIPLLLTGSAIGLTNFFYYLSVNYISASLAIIVLMQFTWFSLMLEWIVFTKKPSRYECLTIFFILVGSVMASNIISHNSLFFSYKGIAFALLASLTYAVYIVANGRLGKGVNWQSKSTCIMIGSALTIFLISNRTIIFDNHFSLPFFVYAIFLAVIGTAIPTALFAIGIPKVGSGISSILMTIELPIAILCASIILGEHVDSIQIAGIIIVLASISAMNYYKSMKLLKTQKNK